ncbi:hypothetical protein HHL11_29240 [Ramlibacter sp. G-1-2-2]|uniref:Uncharacterized protein n=1 Tax=Ramlibacter agri TaxID=2728837 RepID=A0A848HEG3_9BURK|nr:hypothetical protein [Ramlibacter agri]NML47870.1 hypothetical protein [Ramlibacter agri]
MRKRDWQAEMADFLPLYEAGAYTTDEFFWFALPFFEGDASDREVWNALPQAVKDRFRVQMEKEVEAEDDATRAALLERLAAVRGVAGR